MNERVDTLAETRGDILVITEPVETRDSTLVITEPAETRGDTLAETETLEAVTSGSQQEAAEKKTSVAQQIRSMILSELLNEKIAKVKLTKMMAVLVDAEKCRSVLKLRYAFLKKATNNKEDRKEHGHYRYGSQTIKIGKTDYYWVTNDLYQRQMAGIQEWLNNL